MTRNVRQVFFAAAVFAVATLIGLKTNAEDVRSAMKKNFEALVNLQEYVADPVVFSDPKNKEAIQKNLNAISDMKHVFPQKMSEQEPGLAAIASLFSEYLKDVQNAFSSGASGPFVRNQIRTMTGFCLSCHTRVGTSVTFVDVENKIGKSKLTEFQKAEFYAATRQFDKALAAFEKIIAEKPQGEFGYIELGRAVREALSITVRVKQDPKATLALLNKLSLREDLPEFFQRYVTEWRKDAVTWMSETRKPKELDAPQLISRARSLIQQAQKRQLYPVDPSGDITFLRATNYIHEALQKQPKGKFRGEALYMLGSCYGSLQDPLLWALDSLYFEACIREFPHTNISRQCYKRYASKLYFDYSGSGGTFIPQDEVKKLGELRKLAQ